MRQSWECKWAPTPTTGPLCVEQPCPELPGNVSPECNMLVLTGMYGSAKTERKYLWPLSFTRSAWHDCGERHRRNSECNSQEGGSFFFLECVNKQMCDEYLSSSFSPLKSNFHLKIAGTAVYKCIFPWLWRKGWHHTHCQKHSG